MQTMSPPAQVAAPAAAPHASALAGGRQAIQRGLRAVLVTVGHALGSIFFIADPWIGLMLGLAFVGRPLFAAFALTGVAVGFALTRVLALAADPHRAGAIHANALLAAVVTGWVTSAAGAPVVLQFVLAGVAAAPAALIAAALAHYLARALMPVVLLGYAMAASTVLVICPQCAVLASNAMPAWPQLADARGWAETLLRSLAALMYGHSAAAGLFVALPVLAWSRALFACGIAGWVGGAAAAYGLQQLQLPYFWQPLSYNFFIAGMALGGALFLPGRASVPVAGAAGAVTAFFGLSIQYALAGSAVSYLPISSALAVWVGIGALSRIGERAPAQPGDTRPSPPERQWWMRAYWRARFGVEVPLFALPCAGELQVSQGFGGRISHQGLFHHAVDLQRPRSAGLGAIFGADVLAPVAGTVERVRNHVPDNLPGACNHAERWGNYVVIRLDAGGWALLAHLQQGSIAVLPGMRVEVGTLLGRAGNSGRSTFAHLHLQLQSAPEPGAATLPFRLANYLQAVQGQPEARPWVASAVPAQGEVIVAAPRNPAVYQALTGLVPGTGVWTAEVIGRVPRAWRPPRHGSAQRMDMAIDGLGHYVFTADGGSLLARLDADAWRVVAVTGNSALLRLLALAIPTIPYGACAGVGWTDLPPLLPRGPVRGAVALALAPYLPSSFVQVASGCASEPTREQAFFEVASHPDHPARGLPRELGCRFAPLKGPVQLRAEFPAGSITWTLLSYQPGGSSAAAPA